MSDDVLDLEAYAPYYLRAISNKLAQVASRIYGERFGIGLNEWSCLALLAREQDVSATRIAEVSGFDKAIISRSLRALEDKALIVSVGVEHHNRKRLISLTDAGWEVYTAASQLARQREAALLSDIDEGDRLKLIELLRRLHANVVKL